MTTTNPNMYGKTFFELMTQVAKGELTIAMEASDHMLTFRDNGEITAVALSDVAGGGRRQILLNVDSGLRLTEDGGQDVYIFEKKSCTREEYEKLTAEQSKEDI